MGFDAAFQYIGQGGLFQTLLFLVLAWPGIFTGSLNMSMVFLGPSPGHFCAVGRLENLSYAQQRYVAAPELEDREGYSSCRLFDLNYDNLTDEALMQWNRSDLEVMTPVRSCDRWKYDQSQFLSTIVSKFNLVCGKDMDSQVAATVYLMGMLVGAAVSGALSDRFGRQRTLAGLAAAHVLVGVGVAFIESFWLFVAGRFLLAAASHGTFLCAFVIVTELIGPTYRPHAACMYQMAFTVGFLVLPFMAYFIRDAFLLQLVLVLPVSLTVLSYTFLVPESPRWLLSQGRTEESEAILRQIALINDNFIPDDISEELSHVGESHPKGSYLDLFRYPNMRKEILIVYLNWFTNNLLYYGFSLNTGTLGGSLYLNTLISGAVEVPARLGLLYLINALGRRPSIGLSLLLAAAANAGCVLLLLLARDDLAWLLTTFTMLGKVGITASFTGIYVYTAELFPTCIRQVAIGSSSTMARVSGLLAPFMGEPMMKIWAPLPSVVFGLFALASGLTTFLLPETKGLKMPDTIEEAEAIGRGIGRKMTLDGRRGTIVSRKSTGVSRKATLEGTANPGYEESELGAPPPYDTLSPADGSLPAGRHREGLVASTRL